MFYGRKILYLFFVVLVFGQASGQDLSPEERLEIAQGKALDGFHQEATLEFEVLSSEFPGTEIDAVSRLERAHILARLREYSQMTELYESVKIDFPDSYWEVNAALNLLDFQLLSSQRTLEDYLSQLDLQIERLGGVSLFALDPHIEFSSSALPENESIVLLKLLYDTAAGRILGRPDSEIDEERLQLAESIVNFSRVRFDDSQNLILMRRNISFLRMGDESVFTPEGDLTPPKVHNSTPTLLSSHDYITLELDDSRLQASQIDISTIRLSVDAFLVDTLELEAISETGQLEVLKLRYRPQEGWPPGLHEVTLHVADFNGNSDSIEFSFLIPATEDVEVPILKDTFLLARDQHLNEGANIHLTLEKVQGKAVRSAVAFDLSDINLNGLSKATLTLMIAPSEQVNGWGNGRTISVQAITTPWQEGNGWNFGLKKKDQIAGDGAGATWFSPVDENIGNDSSNSAVNWNGAASSVSPPTSPAIQIVNFQSGEVAFDVTADVLNGAEHGWLILKDQENVGSKVSFYSREGAAAAGNPDLAPRLLLEFGQVASNSSETQSETLLSRIGFGAIDTKLRPISGSEVRSVKQFLQENKVAALAVEQLVSQATLTNPVANWTTRLAYRSWVSESIQIAANLEMTRS